MRSDFGQGVLHALNEAQCNIENIFQDGDWAILEWSDPLGLRGCGFFEIKNDRISFQRGYFDQLTFHRVQSDPTD